MTNREYVMLEDKNGKEVLPVTDGNGVFVEGGTKKLDKKLTEINEQLDTITNEYIRLNNLDIFDGQNIINGDKVSAILADNTNTYFLESGDYLLNSPIDLRGSASIVISDGATLKANTNMDYMLNIYSVGNNKNKKIIGGTFDGNYLAKKCINVEYTHETKISDIYIKNPLNYGIYVDGGYGATYEKIKCINDKDSLSLNEDATGFYLKTADTMIFDLVVCNYAVGLEVARGANVINKVHIWANKPGIIKKSYGIVERSGFNSYTDTYCDTCNVGIHISAVTPFSSKFNSPKFTYGNDYRPSGATPIFIICQSEEIQYINDGFFSFNKTSETSNTIQVWSGKNLEFTNSTYINKTNLTNVPVDIQKTKLVKSRITVPGATINAGTYLTQTVTLNGVKYNDTAIFNSIGYYDRSLVVSYLLLDNTVNVTIFNPTSSNITITDTNVYVTYIRDNFGNVL